MDTTTLPSPRDIQQRFPRTPSAQAFIEEMRFQAKQIVSGKDSRKALIVGPCSIHHRLSAIEYAKKIKALSKQVENTCFLLMRVYVEKPRTSLGWKGFLYDPHLDASHDIMTGILWTRELFFELTEMKVPCAAEFVDPLAALYFEDFLTWGFIGARTSSSQTHRQFASFLQMPVGFKNSTDGNVDNAIHGVEAAQTPHTSIHINLDGQICAIQSQGNPHTHIVLRGSDHCSNYDLTSINKTLSNLYRHRLSPRLMIDCSHGNAQGCFNKQKEALLSVLEEEQENVFGFMLESHLQSGKQTFIKDPKLIHPSISITDPCLDWQATEKLIFDVDSLLINRCIAHA